MEDTAYLTNNTIYLKKLTIDDISEKYLNWVNDKVVTDFLEIRHKNHNREDLINYVKSFDSDNSHFLFGVFLIDTNEHIGNGTLYNVNYIHRTFDIGYLIGEKKYWGTTVSLETVLILLKFGFDKLKMRKMIGGVYANHIKSRFTLKRLGFSEEARLKEKFIYNGKSVDEIIYSLTDNQWYELRKKYNL